MEIKLMLHDRHKNVTIQKVSTSLRFLTVRKIFYRIKFS